MKQLILTTLLFIGTTSSSFAQSGITKLPGLITDIPGTTNKIVASIIKQVSGLDATQQKNVKDITSKFLGDYNALLPKMKTDPTGFKSSLEKLKNSYDSKLNPAMGVEKFTKFAGTSTGGAATKVLNMLLT